jgi:hypothetical protein
LRHRATSLKVTGSIPDGVFRIFHLHNPTGRTMALGLTQPLTEMSTRNISWGKVVRCLGLTTFPPSCLHVPIVLKSGSLRLLEPSGPVQDCNGIALPFTRRGGWSSPRPGPFSPGNDPVHIVQQAGWAPGPVWTGAENLAPSSVRTPDLQTRSGSLYYRRNHGPTSLYGFIDN